ncbi:hypothetical protein HYW82_03755 [Candidatus Peregrinibacteria bacterium]|nr:hypothetical protein [Candidatus Peregrinibacteria bacterium]
MNKLQPKSLKEELATHTDKLKELGFVNESGELTRPVVTHSESFADELDDRLKHEPEYAQVGELPEMHFLQDRAQPGEEPVYPHHGESNDIIYAVDHFFPGRKFAAAIECFAGAGHGGIKLRNSKSLKLGAPINAVDVNPRAIALARANSTINDAGIQYYQTDILRDGFRSLPDEAKKPGETLYFGNGPFALTPPNRKLEVCRHGGKDGLEMNMGFIKASLEHGSPGDAIVGVAYSRIGTAGNYEFEDRLKQLQAEGKRFTYKIELVEGAKLWRGYNGKKEQDNPMDLSMMTAKGEPGSNIYREYESMAQAYKEEGWDKLAYVRYSIEISEPVTEQATATRTEVGEVVG